MKNNTIKYCAIENIEGQNQTQLYTQLLYLKTCNNNTCLLDISIIINV